MNLITLSHLVHDIEWAERIDRTLKLFGTRLETMGRAVPMMAAALSTYIAGLQQIVIVSDTRDDAMRQAIARRYLPFAITLDVSADRKRALTGSLPWIAAMAPVNGAPTAYVCSNFTCRQPVTTVDALVQELRAGA